MVEKNRQWSLNNDEKEDASGVKAGTSKFGSRAYTLLNLYSIFVAYFRNFLCLLESINWSTATVAVHSYSTPREGS